jgi:hypothetical protein
MLGAMARIAPARPATRPTTAFFPRFLFSPCSHQKFEKRTGGGLAVTTTTTTTTTFTTSTSTTTTHQKHDFLFFIY